MAAEGQLHALVASGCQELGVHWAGELLMALAAVVLVALAEKVTSIVS